MKLEGVNSNRSAIGARVLVHAAGKTQAQAVVSQSSFYSSNDPRLHFGLGSSRDRRRRGLLAQRPARHLQGPRGQPARHRQGRHRRGPETEAGPRSSGDGRPAPGRGLAAVLDILSTGAYGSAAPHRERSRRVPRRLTMASIRTMRSFLGVLRSAARAGSGLRAVHREHPGRRRRPQRRPASPAPGSRWSTSPPRSPRRRRGCGSGNYRFLSLAPGSYKVTAEAQGFKRAEQTVTLQTNQTLNAPDQARGRRARGDT